MRRSVRDPAATRHLQRKSDLGRSNEVLLNATTLSVAKRVLSGRWDADNQNDRTQCWTGLTQRDISSTPA
jgi:hypothetical protein